MYRKRETYLHPGGKHLLEFIGEKIYLEVLKLDGDETETDEEQPTATQETSC